MPSPDFGIAAATQLDRLTDYVQARPAIQDVSASFCELRMPVFRYLASMLQNPSVAEELTQEVFVRFLIQLREGKPVRDTRVWIFRVARNLALDYKRGPVKPKSLNYKEVESTAPDPEQLAIKSQLMNQYEQKFARLSRQERHCLELRNEGLVYREIGEILGIRISSVATFLGRAIEKLTAGADS